ncbi:unnamed protein product [Meganyctiphanes norvegica]|uniref:RBR-type E3 ubiquitin transferase n=1 Tax=Meganyctiphanes norvegica TaxID=48144 RepID=A0AAV2RQ60_MEGNR
MDDVQDQEDECMVLGSMFDSNFTRDADGGTLHLPLKLAHPLALRSASDPAVNHDVIHLPPLCLQWTYQPTYPSTSPPHKIVTSDWLTQHQSNLLITKLDELWEENQGFVVVFIWAMWLQESSLDYLNIQNHVTLDDQSLINKLKIYDKDMKDKEFESSSFSCNVCYMESAGPECLKFAPCQHVFCKECTSSYFKVQIQEGNFSGLMCLEDGCEAEPTPKQIEELVGCDLYSIWEEQQLQCVLSIIMGQREICPRPHCRHPVPVDDRKRGECPACGYDFCIVCKNGWHGMEGCHLLNNDQHMSEELYTVDCPRPNCKEEVTMYCRIGSCNRCQLIFCGLCRYKAHPYRLCPLKSPTTRSILSEYIDGCADTQALHEDCYGRKYLINLRDHVLHEIFISKCTKPCPKCFTPIVKQSGCNKMICARCYASFCWICTEILDKDKPYEHFRSSETCVDQLFTSVDESSLNFSNINNWLADEIGDVDENEDIQVETKPFKR